MDECPKCGTRDETAREYLNETEYFCLGDLLVDAQGYVPIFRPCELLRVDFDAIERLEEEAREAEREERELQEEQEEQERRARRLFMARQGGGELLFCPHGEIATRQCVVCRHPLCERSFCSISVDGFFYCVDHCQAARDDVIQREKEEQEREEEAKRQEEAAERKRYLALPVPTQTQWVKALESGENFLRLDRGLRFAATWRVLAAAAREVHGQEELFLTDRGKPCILALDGILYERTNESDRGRVLARPDDTVQMLVERLDALREAKSRSTANRQRREAVERATAESVEKERAVDRQHLHNRKFGESALAKTLWPLNFVMPALSLGLGLIISHAGELGSGLMESAGRGLLYGLLVLLQYVLPVLTAFCVTMGGLGFANAMIDRGGRIPVGLFFLGLPFLCGLLYGG